MSNTFKFCCINLMKLAWFDHPEERFSHKKAEFKKFCLMGENQLPWRAVGNLSNQLQWWLMAQKKMTSDVFLLNWKDLEIFGMKIHSGCTLHARGLLDCHWQGAPEINSCFWSWARCQTFLCLERHSNEAKGSIQCRIDLFASFACQTADNCDKSY